MKLRKLQSPDSKRFRAFFIPTYFVRKLSDLTQLTIGANLINKEVIYYLGFKRNLA